MRGIVITSQAGPDEPNGRYPNLSPMLSSNYTMQSSRLWSLQWSELGSSPPRERDVKCQNLRVFLFPYCGSRVITDVLIFTTLPCSAVFTRLLYTQITMLLYIIPISWWSLIREGIKNNTTDWLCGTLSHSSQLQFLLYHFYLNPL